LTRKDFDKLSDDDKRASFTVTALRNTSKSLGRVQRLKELIGETLDIRDEEKAWEAYWQKAKVYLREEEKTSATKTALFVSFRYARQSAYSFGIDQEIADNKSSTYAIRLVTQEDTRVRSSHRKWHGVTLPADHKVWKDVKLPWDFNCRCLKKALTRAEMRAGGVRFTPENEIPPIPEGFDT